MISILRYLTFTNQLVRFLFQERQLYYLIPNDLFQDAFLLYPDRRVHAGYRARVHGPGGAGGKAGG